MEHLTKLHSNGRLLSLPANIRLGWKSMQVANTLAYYYTTLITAVKSFIVKAAGLEQKLVKIQKLIGQFFSKKKISFHLITFLTSKNNFFVSIVTFC